MYQVETPRRLRLHLGVVMQDLQRAQLSVVPSKRGAGPKAVNVLNMVWHSVPKDPSLQKFSLPFSHKCDKKKNMF